MRLLWEDVHCLIDTDVYRLKDERNHHKGGVKKRATLAEWVS